jgi:pullulanase
MAISTTDATAEERKQMYKLALSIVLTSQGISFLHAGTEFLRTKKGVENSFESPDSINAIDWSLKSKNKDVFEYVQALIKMRKEHPAFRMTSAKQVSTLIYFSENTQKGVIIYEIDGKAVNDKWEKIQVMFNGTAKSQSIELNSKLWQAAVINNEFAKGENKLVSAELKPFSCSILYKHKTGLKE